MKNRKTKRGSKFLLPSAGDTSYCGSLLKDGKLHVSYYSQHEIEERGSEVGASTKPGEGPAGIYLAVLTDEEW